MNYYLAIDTAYEQGLVVLFSKKEVIFSVELNKKLDHAKEICGAIEKALDYAKLKELKICAFFCGLGPGSFVGVRIALATALGFCMAKDLPLMGFCSYRALIREKEDCFIYMKASGDLGYFASFTLKDDLMHMSEPHVVPISKLSNFYGKVLSDQADKLNGVEKILGPTAHGIFEACLYRLKDGLVDEKGFIKPNYVKPPSITMPKAS